MIVLIANLGSTSFKYKLFDMPAERLLAVGAADRIGQGQSAWSVETLVPMAQKRQGTTDLTDHAAAIELHLKELIELGTLKGLADLQAIGFKAVHGGPISGAVRVDEQVLGTMQQFADLAPQHNPPYIAAMKAFAQRLPGVPQVAAFETAYHQTIPLARQVYAIPHAWVNELGIRRYGFHGASHRYIATRIGELMPQAKKIVSLHLGGSCSITAIQDGRSVANSFGTTTQSGVFHASRVGEFDPFAILKLMNHGLDLPTIFARLGKDSGLKGLSGISADLRDVEKAAAQGNTQAALAVEAFVETCRHYLGAYLAILNGADAVAFTGGIGQHAKAVRQAICQNLDYAGIVLDNAQNDSAIGSAETRIDASSSRVAIWVLPTNEELIVARQTFQVLTPPPPLNNPPKHPPK